MDGSTAFLTYEREGDTVAMTHTIVPPPIEGRGVAARAHAHRRRVGAGRGAADRPAVLLRARVAAQERLTGRRAPAAGRRMDR